MSPRRHGVLDSRHGVLRAGSGSVLTTLIPTRAAHLHL